MEDYVPTPTRTDFALTLDGVDVIGSEKADSWGVYVRAYGNTQIGNMTGCEVKDWAIGVYTREAGGAVQFTANENQIYDNLDWGFYSNTAIAQDATMNWWGTASGPFHLTTNDDGEGNDVSDYVIFDPWWANEGMTLVGSNAPIENVTQNLFYDNIQDAIDDADDYDQISVKAGVFDQTMNIAGKTGIRITGMGEAQTLFKPSTAIPWDYFGHTTGRRSAIRIVESSEIVIEGITLDCDLIKNNGWYGAFVGNASATIQNSTLKNMYTDQSHYYDIMIYARSLSPYSDTNRTTLNVLGCKLIDTGRVGIVTHDYVHSVIDGNQIYKTTNTFGYGMEIGSSSTAVITDNVIYGFDTPAVSDGSISGGIYIENAFTSAVVEAIEKLIVIDDNEVSDCQIGLTVGNQFNNYAGNVDMILQVTNNDFVNNIDYGILLTDEDKSNGSSVTAVLTGNTISTNLATPDAVGVMVYAVGDGDLNVSLVNNVVTGYDYGLLVYEYGDPAGSSFVLSATGNTFSNAECGVYTGNVNWIPVVRLNDNPYYSGNTFQDNTIHMDNSNGEAIDMEAVIAANTFVGGAYQFDQIIYSSTAGVIYADAPEELIKDSEEQTYAIKAVTTENLRGATVRIVISAVDFAQPHTFTMGVNFEFMDIVESHTLTEWIYDVTISTLGTGGVTANDYVFFTWKMSSQPNAQNLAGSIIGVPYDNITMYDEMNQPIAVLGSADAVVVIDSGEPTLVQETVNAGLYPSGMLLSIDPAGSGLLVRPTLQYDVTDDYNLDYTRYLIYPVGGTVPALIADFSMADAMGAVDGETSVVNWQLPAIVDTYADDTYTAYFLVVDDAGNFNIYTWNFEIDKSAPAIPAWTSCLTTPDSNNSVDLVWTGSADKYDIWVLNYSDLLDAGDYPVYNPAAFGTPELPAAPNAYSGDVQNGWTRVADDVAALSYIHTPASRGYYYYYLFAQDLAGNFSAASQLKESISYWPGDVSTATDGEVTSADIALLANVWGLLSTNPLFENEFDVGPSVGRARRGRPTPDGRINIEDLMMFSMNYENTNYGTYPRSSSDSRPLAVKVQMQTDISGNELTVNFMLTENNGEIKGLNIPMEYGSGLELLSMVQGPVWGDESMVLYTNEGGVFELSGARLDAGFLEGDGLVASLVFKINGQETDLTLKHMIARAADNSDIDIIDNPENTPSDVDDPAVLPTVSFLGSAYPNPFNPSTTISFGLNESGSVNVKVYNARGQLVDTLVNGVLQAGLHTVVWNGLDYSGRPMGSGIYFIRMQTRSTDQTIKTTLIK